MRSLYQLALPIVAALGLDCVTVNSYTVKPCEGIGRAAPSRNPHLAKNSAENRALDDYLRKCENLIPGSREFNAAKTGENTSIRVNINYNPAEGIATARKAN